MTFKPPRDQYSTVLMIAGLVYGAAFDAWAGAFVVVAAVMWRSLEHKLEHQARAEAEKAKAEAESSAHAQALARLAKEVQELAGKVIRIENRGNGR